MKILPKYLASLVLLYEFFQREYSSTTTMKVFKNNSPGPEETSWLVKCLLNRPDFGSLSNTQSWLWWPLHLSLTPEILSGDRTILWLEGQQTRANWWALGSRRDFASINNVKDDRKRPTHVHTQTNKCLTHTYMQYTLQLKKKKNSPVI